MKGQQLFLMAILSSASVGAGLEFHLLLDDSMIGDSIIGRDISVYIIHIITSRDSDIICIIYLFARCLLEGDQDLHL